MPISRHSRALRPRPELPLPAGALRLPGPVVTDQPLVAQLLEVINRRRLEMRQHYQVEGYDELLLGDGKKFVSVWSESSLEHYHLLLISGLSEPSYRLEFDLQGGIYNDLHGYEQAAQFLRRLNDEPCQPPLHVPFGVLEGETITEIFWIDLDGEGYGCDEKTEVTSDLYIADSHTGSRALEFTDGDYVTFTERFWHLYRQGRVINLINRIRNYPTSISVVLTPGQLPYLELQPDSVVPRLAPHYYFWFGRDPEPLGPAGRTYLQRLAGQNERRELRSWF